MGYYIAHSFDLTLKEDAPEVILLMLKDLTGLTKDTAPHWAIAAEFCASTGKRYHPDDIAPMLQAIGHLLAGSAGSRFYNNWHRAVRWTTTDSGRNRFNTRSSGKDTYDEEVAMFLRLLTPYLVLNEGDIVARSIGESERVEDIVVWTGERFEFLRSEGYFYTSQYDEQHPKNNTDRDWEPPLVLSELKAVVNLRVAVYRKEQEEILGGYGF